MNLRTFKLFPPGKALTIFELEKALHYRHVPKNEFETAQSKEDIQQKGLEQEKKGQVPKISGRFGKKFHPKIVSSYIPEVSIRWVHPSIGYGLFAEEIIQQGAYVGEYTGTVRRNDRNYGGPLNDYCYQYPVTDEIGRSYVIDATSGSLTRFINHSSTPNLQAVHVYSEGFYHLIFMALREIKPQEQFSYDYGESYWYLREKPMCF